MAKNHTCHTVTCTVGNQKITLNYIRTSASNIKIMSFSRDAGRKTKRTLEDSGEYGINASWFAMSTDNHISNLAYQDGVRQGYFLEDSEVPIVNGVKTDGFTNSIGKSIIYYRNGSVYFSSNVVDSSSNKVIGSDWVQGGAGLFFGYRDWKDMFAYEGDAGIYLSGSAERTALVIDTGATRNNVYLIVTQDSVSVENFRAAIMQAFDIEEGDTATDFRGILLDGGGSTQLEGSELSITSSRPVPQIVALKNKN